MSFFSNMLSSKTRMPQPGEALPGRAEAIATADRHLVTGRPLKGPFPEGLETVYFGMGCFWGAERLFWQTEGVWLTAVGYQGGFTPNPTYQETCTGRTGHAEVVQIRYDPGIVSFEDLLRIFWENHDPTQGMRQGNDIGTTYRSVIFHTTAGQAAMAEASRSAYQRAIDAAGGGRITTQIAPAPDFYFAEADHQQYLARVPDGYCGLRGTGIALPAGQDSA